MLHILGISNFLGFPFHVHFSLTSSFFILWTAYVDFDLVVPCLAVL